MNARVARAASISLTGITGTRVLVEAAVSQQLPGMSIIGLPDAALAEAKLRVRSATANSGVPISERFLTVNLSPASLPKHGSAFDLAIALAALGALRHVPEDALASIAHLGELGLDGELRRPAGLLPAVLAAHRIGFTRVMVPSSCAAEASLVSGIDVVAVPNLSAALAWHRGERQQKPADVSAGRLPQAMRVATTGAEGLSEQQSHHAVDMSDVVGQPEAVAALTIAAAGRHHVSMVGPPGAGKTLLASRLPTILPDLSADESLTASSIAALGGSPINRLVRRPPFEAPHHTASAVSVIGGGDGTQIRPGAITRASFGVLFLDEAPEFPRRVLDALRQPLESGLIEIHRARLRAELPAEVQLVLAANPCPCGKAGSPDTDAQCNCSPSTRLRYAQRISGPLADRIDVRLTVRRVSSLLRDGRGVGAESSQVLRQRVSSARAAAAERLRATPWRTNAEVSGRWLRDSPMRLPATDTAILDRALHRGLLTLRGYDRVLRVAWSVADLAGKSRPNREDIAHALTLRGERAA